MNRGNHQSSALVAALLVFVIGVALGNPVAAPNPTINGVSKQLTISIQNSNYQHL